MQMHSGKQAVGVVHLQGMKDSHLTLWFNPVWLTTKACMGTSFHPWSSR